jgi:hypothetical protein
MVSISFEFAENHDAETYGGYREFHRPDRERSASLIADKSTTRRRSCTEGARPTAMLSAAEGAPPTATAPGIAAGLSKGRCGVCRDVQEISRTLMGSSSLMISK